MPALQRAIAIADVHDVAVRIGHDLHFDVTRAWDHLLDVHLRIAERALGLAPRGLERGVAVRPRR